MKSFSYTVTDPVGIHARPAGNLVKAIKDYNCEITMSGNGKSVNAKKLMMVMTLGIKQGQEVELSFDGPDEEAAAEATLKYMQENL